MADQPRYPDTDDTGMDAGQEPTPGVRRWIVVLVIGLAMVLLVLLAVLHLTGVVGPK